MINKLYRAWDGINLYEFNFNSIDNGNIMVNSDCPFQTPANYGFAPLSKMEISDYIGFTDKNDKKIFNGDICLFKFINDGFECSKAGELMQKCGADELLIVFNIPKYFQLDYKIFLRKGKELITKFAILYEPDDLKNLNTSEYEELLVPWYERGDSLHYIKYLLNKNNLEIIGNKYENLQYKELFD